MTREQLNDIQSAVAKAIQTNVNGKIDKLTTKLEDHIVQHTADTQKIYDRFDELKPIQNAWNSGKFVAEALRWAAGVVAAVIVLNNFFGV